MSNAKKIEELKEKKQNALLGGGEVNIRKQHDKGKLTAQLPPPLGA